ncbi:class B sortase [Anaerococcus sp. AGMB00486]|uniref:Class B sortase n=2 Tax=Anaerococcus TaxID=165779 RepID=A0ABX2NBN3_9FIRM|nr:MULTISPECIES: class B sortase [Anaerococcus]MDY3006620.1 class B sortase [Anaerococcus porci]MSS78089.1 class B sortase [Anaerococcus porci]NVF12107.1 class B sortase [Anaerococcus faecalis]
MKDKLLKVFRFILVIIIIVCLIILGKRGYDYYTNHKNNEHISDIVESVEKDYKKKGKDKETFEQKEEKSLAILKKLQEENSDVTGFIEIPGTYIAYPVMKSNDNEFYLRKGINKEYDIAGSLFMDYQNDREFNDDNTVIYGHFLEDIPSMFTALKDFREQEYAQNNRTIYITTDKGLREYEIFSVYGTPADYDYRSLAFGDGEYKLNYFKKLKDKSEVNLESPDFREDDKIITLSTCQYDYADQRLAVHALRIR